MALLAVMLLASCASTVTSPSPGGEGEAARTGAELGGPGYQIGPEDLLHISVWKEEELDREVLVRPDGGVSFPLAGDVQAAGKSPEELKNEIQKRIRRFIPEAVVTVSVDEVSGYSIFVIGKVNEPGQFTLGRYVDVIQALTLAGGVTPFADEDSITVRRRVNGREEVYAFEYDEVKSGQNREQNITLQSGDVVVVP